LRLGSPRTARCSAGDFFCGCGRPQRKNFFFSSAQARERLFHGLDGQESASSHRGRKFVLGPKGFLFQLYFFGPPALFGCVRRTFHVAWFFCVFSLFAFPRLLTATGPPWTVPSSWGTSSVRSCRSVFFVFVTLAVCDEIFFFFPPENSTVDRQWKSTTPRTRYLFQLSCGMGAAVRGRKKKQGKKKNLWYEQSEPRHQVEIQSRGSIPLLHKASPEQK
jgi:hypothetical protein